MKEETGLKLSIITLVYLLIVLMVIIPPCETQDLIIIDSGHGPTNIITANNEYSEIHEILMKNDFNNWEPEEQGVLTQMMQLTSNGVGFDDEFIKYINSMNRSEDIFNTYIDLMEHAGY